jgi:cytochrome c-type biogenesis protein CcmH
VPRHYLAALLAFASLGCDRNVEPFVPGEEPRQPDLSRIFPAGAERAEQRGAGVEMPPPTEQGGRGADPTAEAPPIRGAVRVADALAARVPPNAVLFLIARGGAGGPPLAVQRIPAPRFPFEFELGPADRMIRTLPFAGELQLTARLDQDGDAGTRSPGDLEGGAAGAHAPGATGVEIVLDRAL